MRLFWRSELSVEFNYSTELYQILDFLTTKNCNFDLNTAKCGKIYVNKAYNSLTKLRPALNLTGQPRWLIYSLPYTTQPPFPYAFSSNCLPSSTSHFLLPPPRFDLMTPGLPDQCLICCAMGAFYLKWQNIRWVPGVT